jgi:hypothetical protein
MSDCLNDGRAAPHERIKNQVIWIRMRKDQLSNEFWGGRRWVAVETVGEPADIAGRMKMRQRKVTALAGACVRTWDCHPVPSSGLKDGAWPKPYRT